MKKSKGFTLIELMVVVAIIATLLGILLPALASARKTAQATKCLSGMRNMEVAHWMYMTDHDGQFIDVGLGGPGHDPANSWINTLSEYYGSPLLHRSPVDDSIYWDAPGNGGVFRRTSYGVNNYLIPNPGPGITNPVVRFEQVPKPSSTVHFMYMSESDPTYAVSDHPHIEQWPTLAPLYPNNTAGAAASQLETHAHGGVPGSWEAVTNYSYVDGHAQTTSFSQVYAIDGAWNKFDPTVAR